jgi:hypothetical protein
VRKLPGDPNELVVNWVYHEHSIIVWEDPNEVVPWTLRWEFRDGPDVVWSHEEHLESASDALTRSGVIIYSIEHDRRLV